MEVACGEYGDMVPPLVVAVQNNYCALYQCQQKVTNCNKLSTTATVTAATLVDHNTLRRLTNVSDEQRRPDISSDPRQTDILNDEDDDADDVTDDVRAAAADNESPANCVALLHNSCRRAVPTLVLTNGDISCDVTLLKEVRLLSRSRSLLTLTRFLLKHSVGAWWTYVAVLLVLCLTDFIDWQFGLMVMHRS